jgi:hypothetical protein
MSDSTARVAARASRLIVVTVCLVYLGFVWVLVFKIAIVFAFGSSEYKICCCFIVQ